jgi:hypothetical protein
MYFKNPRPRTVSNKREREIIFNRQGGKCAIGIARGRGVKCRMGGILDRRLFEIDHIHEYADGGLTESHNLQALCPLCHKRKTALLRTQRKLLRLSSRTNSI